MGAWCCLKTTLEISDTISRRAKAFAATKGITLKQLFNEAWKKNFVTPLRPNLQENGFG
jgi:hypothetical protein